jgi:hypothetical protein
MGKRVRAHPSLAHRNRQKSEPILVLLGMKSVAQRSGRQDPGVLRTCCNRLRALKQERFAVDTSVVDRVVIPMHCKVDVCALHRGKGDL